MVLSGLSTILAFSLSVWGLRNAASSVYRLVSTGKSAFLSACSKFTAARVAAAPDPSSGVPEALRTSFNSRSIDFNSRSIDNGQRFPRACSNHLQVVETGSPNTANTVTQAVHSLAPASQHAVTILPPLRLGAHGTRY